MQSVFWEYEVHYKTIFSSLIIWSSGVPGGLIFIITALRRFRVCVIVRITVLVCEKKEGMPVSPGSPINVHMNVS